MPWLLLGLSIAGAMLTLNVYRPIHRPAPPAAASFLAGWLVGELAGVHIVVQAVITALLGALGAFEGWPGWVALGLSLLSWGALYRWQRRAADLLPVLDEVIARGLGLRPASTGPSRRPPKLSDYMPPFPVRHPGVLRERNAVYHRIGRLELKLDVFRPRERPCRAPMLLFVHGGGWVMGSKDEQGLPTLVHMASKGWVCFNMNYRLSPRATFPDPIVDVKRAILWAREHGAEHGGDPDFLVVAGGSAGGHLAALAALSPGDPLYQPDFEEADTAVQGCVAYYGVYDLCDRFGHWPSRALHRLVERAVFKARLAEEPERFERASPIARVGPHAPPFLLLHGTHDTMVPPAEARRFAEALRSVSREPVALIEVPGAQHAFDVFRSPRCLLALRGVEAFLSEIRRRQEGAGAGAVGGGGGGAAGVATTS